MSASHRMGIAALLLCCACGRATEVELRLHACALDGAVPVRVDLEIRGLDAAGEALPVLTASFDIDPETLADGYATVGLRKPAGLVDADFTVTWHDGAGGSEVVVLLDRPVPAVGEVLELGAEECMPVDPGTSSEGTSGTTEDPSTGSSSSSTTTTTGATSSTSGEDTSTSTGTSSTTTGDTTSGTTTGDTSTSTGSTDDTTEGTTGEPSKLNTKCDDEMVQFYCEHGGPGQVGTILNCKNDIWELGDIEMICGTLIADNCPAAQLGLEAPVAVGCSGYDLAALTCVCKDTPTKSCMEQVGCGPGEEITLCDEDERVRAVCSYFCKDEVGGPVCVEDPP